MSKSILTINLSPRKQGTSAVMLAKCASYLTERGHSVQHMDLYSHLTDFQEIFDAVCSADTLIFAGPCYANTYPADTIKLLEELASRPDILHGQKLYGIIQGGMPYAHTHVSGLNMLKIFASKANVVYQGGFVMGLGAMLDGRPLRKLPNGKKVERQMDIFCKHIHNGTVSPDSVYEASLIKMPRFIVWLLAKLMNNKIDKTFAERGMDANLPCPYSADELI